MIPRLTTRGKLVLSSILLFLLVGALHAAPPLVGMGGMVLAVLLAVYLSFFPTAILLRRKKIELSWWVPPGDQPGGALSVERPFALHLAFRNHGSRRLRVLSTRVLAGTGLHVDGNAIATVGPGQQVEVVSSVTARTMGHHVFHGAALTLGEALGLFEIEAYFPNPIAIKVFPRALPSRGATVRAVGGALHEHIGMHHVRRRGLAGELRELRQHSHGDPFKFIAWKATAKRGQLMVRDLETEIVSSIVVLLDAGASMRSGPPGGAPLDWACDAVAGLSRATLTAGDRFGLVGFDTRTVTEAAPDAGNHHYLQVVDRLIDLRAVVDEDLTDVTAGELVALVARYLAHQEAVDVRIRTAPPLDDPRWSHIQGGPDGQLYDVAGTARLVSRLIEVMVSDRRLGKNAARSGAGNGNGNNNGSRRTPTPLPVPTDPEPQLALLRRFCRLRGIELPYRSSWEHARRAGGLHAAVQRAVSFGRPDLVVLFSDLAGWAEDEAKTTRALSRLRRAAGSVVAVVPAAAAYLPAATSSYGARTRSLLLADAAATMAADRKLLTRHGIGVVEAAPGDALDGLLGRSRRAARPHAAVAG
ncbi:MAG: DUF58 domain-containing protein [Myxococcales bacterium]|nr:DUF58 domain-containing protein [Myxococcales bacterium]